LNVPVPPPAGPRDGQERSTLNVPPLPPWPRGGREERSRLNVPARPRCPGMAGRIGILVLGSRVRVSFALPVDLRPPPLPFLPSVRPFPTVGTREAVSTPLPPSHQRPFASVRPGRFPPKPLTPHLLAPPVFPLAARFAAGASPRRRRPGQLPEVRARPCPRNFKIGLLIKGFMERTSKAAKTKV